MASLSIEKIAKDWTPTHTDPFSGRDAPPALISLFFIEKSTSIGLRCSSLISSVCLRGCAVVIILECCVEYLVAGDETDANDHGERSELDEALLAKVALRKKKGV